MGFVIGSFSAIPRPYTCFTDMLFLSLVGAFSGTVIALGVYFTADTGGWLLAHTIGLAMIGFMDGLCAPIHPSSRRIGLVSRLVLEWASKGVVAGLLATTIAGLVMGDSNGAQAKLVAPVVISLLLFGAGAVRYELWVHKRKAGNGEGLK
jgi:hypothetical protein